MYSDTYPLISVIVPVYNVEKYITEAVDSIRNQTYKNLEIILIDDGSIDKSGAMCDKFAQRDPRINVLHKKNGGLSSARNFGLNHTNGEYIYFIDSDDFIEKETISVLYDAFTRNKQVGIVSSPCFYRYTKGKRSIFRKDWAIEKERTISYDTFCLETLNQQCCHSVCNKLYKKDIIETIRFREGKNNEDTLFMFDLSPVLQEKKMNMLEIPYFSYYYRENEESITMNNKKPFYIDILENLQTLKEEASQKKIIHTIEGLYYKKLVEFCMYLFFLDNELGNKYRKKYYQYYYNLLTATNLKDVFDKTDWLTTTKYFMMKYCPTTCYIYHKIKHIF